MGIDAAMLIRYRGTRPSDDTLNRWSWDMCQSIGAGKLFTSDGIPPDEYQAAIAAWHAAFNAHPLYPQYQAGNRDAHKAIISDIGKAPKCLRRAIELTHRRYPLDDDSNDVPPEYRAPGLAWTQDGDPIFAEPGETFLGVSLWTRYYGPGYERGDILTICAVAEWSETNMQPCEVWYGGDSSGVCAAPFGPTEREAMRKHLYGTQGRAYFAEFDERATSPTPEPCGLCVPGENRFNRCGWGDSYIKVHCAGCGKSFVSNDNGASWAEEKDNA